MFESLRAFFRKSSPIATRSLDFAAGGRRTKGFGATPSIQADILAGRESGARRTRYAAYNQPLIASAVKVFVGDAIGCGIKAVPQTGDDALDAVIAAAHEAWTDRADFMGSTSLYGMQATLANRYFVDGEGWLHLPIDDDELKLRLLDSAQIDNALSRELPGGGYIVAGVELDTRGKIVAYHVFKDYLPGLPLLRGLETSRIPAEDILHLFQVDAAGQVRGLSPLAPVMLRAGELDALNDAQLVRQKIGALLAGFVTDADGALLDGGAAGEPSLEPGTLQRLRPGESVTFSDPPQIGAESNAHIKSVIREIGAGCGIPSFLIDHDMGEVNFSSARVAIVEHRRRIEAFQDHFAFQILRPIYRRWLSIEILSGRISAPLTEQTLRCKFISPKAEWLQPDKDVAAEAQAIAAGLMSRKEAVAARGWNVADIDAEIAADRAREQALGISFAPAAAPQQEPDNAA